MINPGGLVAPSTPDCGAPRESEPALRVSARGAWAIVAVTAAALGALALWNSLHKSMWIDESYSMYTAGRPLGAAIRQALHYELQPPLYFVLLNLWLRLHQSVIFGRLLSTAFAMALVVVMAALGRRVGLRRWPLVAVVVALIPGVVWAAAELRGYSLVMLLAALTWYFFIAVTRSDDVPHRADEVGYIVSAVALMLSFYYGIFVLVGQWLAAAITRRRPRRVAALLAVAGLVLLPLMPTVLRQMGQHPLMEPPLDFLTKTRLALWTTAATAVRGLGAESPILGRPHVVALAVALGVLVVVARLLGRRSEWSSNQVVAAVAGVLPLACIATLRLFALSAVEPRHFLVVVPGLVVFGILWIGATSPAALRAAVAAGVAVAVVTCLVDFERHGIQREDWRGAAADVGAHAAAGDVVLLYDPDRLLPFSYYYRGPAPAFGVPVDIRLDSYAPDTYIIRDTSQIAARVAAVAGSPRGVWLAMSNRLLLQLQPGVGLLSTYLRAHYLVDPPRKFDGITVIYAHER